ncbi:MAG: 30S ribosomal protein S4 [Thermoguttaceae bacterium]|nr:30S ribosomal protein S4 [Thermoguttaceae bacterium]
MGRMLGPVCRRCRREGMKLFLKGARCETPKCAFERRASPPGMHGIRRGKMTDYALHLREKQKVKVYYGVMERQFRRYFQMASRSKKNTGEALMSILERRLDNVVYRLGFAASRRQARQLIRHGHITVNGRKVDIPSYLTSVGDRIRPKDRPKSIERVQAALQESNRQVPDFLVRTEQPVPEGQVVRLPELSDVSIPVQPQLIIEFCSR